MRRHTGTVAGVIMAVMMFIMMTATLAAYASENVPVTMDIPLTYIVNGNEDTAGGDLFTLIPDSEETPMPDGRTGGAKTIRVTKEGTQYFGEITYERPDIYMYTVERDVKVKKGVRKDDTVYRVKVIALNNGEGYMIVNVKDDEAKAELVYRDQVAPKTGDNTKIWMYAIIFGGSAAGLLSLAAGKIAERRKQNREDNE